MKKQLRSRLKKYGQAGLLCVAAVLVSATFFSFRAHKTWGDFLGQLGITRADANQKISNSLLGGFIDAYGLKNARNIASGNRSAVMKDLLQYTKEYVNGAAFVKAYASLRESNKPEPVKAPETPEEMRNNMIRYAEESIASTEENLKKASPEIRPIFEEALKAAKENLKQARDPQNPGIKSYAENYEEMKKSFAASNETRLQEWSSEYPENHLLFVKQRLQQFMEETKDIDFAAQTIEKNNRTVFANPAYERKSNRWKMAFRAGREVIEPARAFVQQWISGIK
jgi:hypothetical protein